MKIAICAQQNNQQSPVDTRFGRAAYFAVYDDQSDLWNFVENSQNTQAAQGAGIQAAQFVIDADAEVLLARNTGPKAIAALQAAGVKVFAVEENMNLEQALNAYTDSRLSRMDQANVEGHWV